MNWNFKTISFVVALFVVVIGGLVWIGKDLRSHKTEVVLRDPEAYGWKQLNPDLESGVEALDGGNLDEALSLLLKVSGDDPGYPVAQYHLGDIYLKRNDPEKALHAFQEIRNYQPENPESHAGIARVMYAMGRNEDAEYNAMRALEIAPDHARVRYEVALYRVAQGNIVDSIPAYARALGLDRDARFRAEALEGLLALRDRSSDLPAVYYALAYFDNVNGNRKDEIEHLERYLQLAPEGNGAATAEARLQDARDTVSGKGSGGEPQAPTDPTQ